MNAGTLKLVPLSSPLLVKVFCCKMPSLGSLMGGSKVSIEDVVSVLM